MKTDAVHALGEVAGLGRLEFEKVAGRTVIREAFAKSPLRLLTPQNHGQAAWAYLSNYGGGLVGGDAIDIQLRVGGAADAVLLSQSTTKIYRSPVGSSQRIEGAIGKDALFVSIPDPITCFEGASFSQEQTYHLEEGASLLLLDMLNCGRLASGERWLFDRFHNQVRVFRDDRPIFHETLRLDGAVSPLADRAGRFNCLSMIVMVGPAFKIYGEEIMRALAARKLQPRSDLVMGASPVGHDSGEGVVIRLGAVSTEMLEHEIRKTLHFIPTVLGDDPWARKW